MSAAGAATGGLVVVDKPAGLTSHDVVARVRRLAGTRKVGHAGTLDPMATGVLVVGVERATRLLGHLTLTEKAYAATIRLGATTTTDDAEGDTLVETSTAHLDEPAVREAAARFEGELQQRPSAVSAIKVDGKRAHARVRAGEEVELPARTVTVHELRVSDVRRGAQHLDLDVTVRCSSGTYVRAIARDLGETLGVGGHLTALRRTAVGPFGLDEARTLEDLTDGFALLALAGVARRCFPAVDLDADRARDVGFGRPLAVHLPADGPVAVFDAAGEFLALYARRPGSGAESRAAVPVAVFV